MGEIVFVVDSTVDPRDVLQPHLGKATCASVWDPESPRHVRSVANHAFKRVDSLDPSIVWVTPEHTDKRFAQPAPPDDDALHAAGIFQELHRISLGHMYDPSDVFTGIGRHLRRPLVILGLSGNRHPADVATSPISGERNYDAEWYRRHFFRVSEADLKTIIKKYVDGSCWVVGDCALRDLGIPVPAPASALK